MQKVFISNEENFTKEEIVKTIKEIAKNLGIKIPAIMKLVRLTISGLRVSINVVQGVSECLCTYSESGMGKTKPVTSHGHFTQTKEINTLL